MSRAINGSRHNERCARFGGKTVVVNGAAHGFGRCIAETFAQLVHACLAAIYPPRNFSNPLRLESTHRCWT
jgi:NAD(P)-dependent dehydrogenase (short-subunit alcohol dehydrogenase family)